jgi:ribosomal protein S27AE
MKKVTQTNIRLVVHACPRCGGSAYLEDAHENDWRCLQCARSVPPPQLVRTRPTAA